ncbi:MAG: chitobiase/beta-hexosaminidase C-terminal domain-containing protein [Bacteroidales bacterium]|nr:chitobiase/beta-hexosaminidase C-terminal domain-containing protein [Bacteroidales bacterium]
MNRIAILFLLTFCASAYGQPQPNIGLIPTPQKVETAQGYCNPAKAKIKELKVTQLPVDANPDQAYQLVVEPKAITIRYIDEAGRHNALLSLEQLKKLYGNALPCLTITDWPAFKWRGWMDDISRGPVPHAEFRQIQWATLHALKYNFCNYYTEHTLYQAEYPDLAPQYAAKCKPHPDEFINLQLFAHAEKTLRIPFYQSMMDSKANYNPGNDEVYVFLRNRIATAINRIPSSPFFIINCDETEQLGSGRAKKLVDEKGADQVYIDHLNRCCKIIQDESRQLQLKNQYLKLKTQPVMWGDIVAKNPAMMRQLPDNMTYIMWAYDPLDSYDRLIKPFREQGNPFWVAPSVSHHSVMVPNPHRYMKNIANLARDGFINGAEGFMNTSWDDSGEALFDNSWHGFFWGAEMAWNPVKTDDPEELKQREEQFNHNFEALFYKSNKSDKSAPSDQPHPNTAALYSFGALESNPKTSDLYVSSSLWEPLLNINPSILNRDNAETLEILANTKNAIDSAANPHLHYAYMHMLACVSKISLQKAIDRQLRQGGAENECLSLASAFLNDLKKLKREYLRLWDNENGDYERHIVMNRYDNLAREVLNLDRHVFIQTTTPGQSSKYSSPGASSSSSNPLSNTPTVSLHTLDGNKDIYYTLDGSEPTRASTLYTKPFPLEHSATIRAIAYNEYGEGVESTQYLLSHQAMGSNLSLATKCGSDFRAVYSGGGDNALIDGQLGSNTSYTDGHWQGYWGDSIDARIDFGSPREIHSVSMRFIQNTFDWVLAPKQIKIYTSNDGKEWQHLTEKTFETDPRETGFQLKHYSIDIPTSKTVKQSSNQAIKQSVQFLRVVVPSGGPLPEWHTAPGQPSWLFCDEIIVK